MPKPSGEIAITVGSRGIANLPTIVRACGDWLKSQGAQPFIVPPWVRTTVLRPQASKA